MTTNTSSLVLVTERFPEHRKSLERLYSKSESFQSLCDDYKECLTSLETWSGSTTEGAPAYRKDFATLLHELDEEILEYVNSEGDERVLVE